MLIVRLINLLYGYVHFTASGGFSDRFINLCSRMSIKAWDLRPKKGAIIGKCRAIEYKKLRHIASKTGMKLHITNKKGLPFFFFRYKKRMGFFVGILIFILFISVMSERIWCLDFSGNNVLSEDTLRTALKEAGISEGIRADSFNASDAERQLLSFVDGLSFIALNVDGSVLHVEVREKIENLEQSDYSHPCHIVASKDGFLKTLETFEGTKSADINTAVSKGQLLISGIIEAKDKSISLCHAKGIAKAETSDEISLQIKKTQTFLSVCDAEFRLKFKIFNTLVPIGFLKKDDTSSVFFEEIHLSANSRRLPVSCIVTRQVMFIPSEKELSNDDAMLLLMSKLHESLIDKSFECEILENKSDFFENGEEVKVSVKLSLLEDIATETDILTEELTFEE